MNIRESLDLVWSNASILVRQPDVQDMLTKLGASSVLARSTFEGEPKPLAKEMYAGAVDTIGGAVLTNVLSMIKYGGTVAACGLAGGMDMKGATVAPFILRGVTLKGVESAFQKMDIRQSVYQTYTPFLSKLELVTHGDDQVIGLDQVHEAAEKIMSGQVKGRYVVKIK